MRQRITYITPPSVNLDSSQIENGPQSFHVSHLQAAKEHRVTVTLSQLPDELAGWLEQYHEVHIRWSSQVVLPAKVPYLSKTAPGLHVFLTPLETKEARRLNNLCQILRRVFGPVLKCHGELASFTSPAALSTRFATSASLQYYSLLPSLTHLADYIQNEICTASLQCETVASSVPTATRLDLDFDAISHAVIVSLYWDRAPSSGWTDALSNSAAQGGQMEVGVLKQENASSFEEIKLGGWLTVVGQDTTPKMTLFSFPSRHHTLPTSSFSASFDKPQGLHPILRLSLRSEKPPSNPSCTLHAYFTLPSELFVDRYAFGDRLFLKSHNLRALRSVSGATDLEAPNWAVKEWGSAILFEIDNPRGFPRTFEVTIPMHLRYLPPQAGGYTQIDWPWPVLFWACRPQDDEAPPLITNPFDRLNLGYDGIFGERAIYYHLQPHLESNQQPLGTIRIPVLDLTQARRVEMGTVAIVLFGAFYLIFVLFRFSGTREVHTPVARRIAGTRVEREKLDHEDAQT